MVDSSTTPDGTVSFMPHRLNRHPTVVRGLTANELWVCSALSAAIGIVLGTPLAFLLSTVAVVPTAILVAVALGVLSGGSALRRMKRGRPDTWLYRQLQWRWVVRWPSLAAYAHASHLVTHSGYWSTRKSPRP